MSTQGTGATFDLMDCGKAIKWHDSYAAYSDAQVSTYQRIADAFKNQLNVVIADFECEESYHGAMMFAEGINVCRKYR